MKFNKHALVVLLSLITVSGVFAPTFNPSGGGGASLTVRENDLSPSVSGVNVLQFTNGTVTDSGGGVASVSISGTGAPTDATYITQTANGTLTNEQALGSLATGCLGSATTTGVISARTITGTANKVTVTNGDCSGNPTLTIPDAVTLVTPTISTSLLLPNGTAVPGTCSIGMIYFDNDATAGVNLYGCTASNTWTLLGDGGGGSGDVTAASTFGTDNVLIRSDGTSKGVQSTGISVSDATNDITGAGSIQFGSNPGDAGRIRLSNGSGEGLCFEIATPGTDKCLTLNTSDQLDFNGTINLSGSTTGSMQVNGATSGSLKVTTADATAQAITITGAAQTTGATTLTIPDQGGTSRNFVFDTLTQTLTGKTYDAEGTGNVLTIPWEVYYPAAGCVNTTAGSVWNLPVSNPAVAACDTGSNVQTAYMGFNDTTDQGFEGSFRLPSVHTGNIDVIVRYKAASATTGAMGWCFQMVRVATGSTSDPAYPAQASGNCVSDTVPGTAGQEDEATITSATCTSCVGGDMIYWRLSRDANGGAVTDSATGDGRVIGFSVRTRRAL